MAHMRRQHEHRALGQIDASGFAVLHGVEIGIALELPEEFLQRVVMKIGALVRAADHRDDEIGVLEQLRITDRRAQQMTVLLQPVIEIQRQHHDISPIG